MHKVLRIKKGIFEILEQYFLFATVRQLYIETCDLVKDEELLL